MPRVNPVASDEASPEVLAMWSDAEIVLGRVPNFLRTVSHSPAVFRWIVPFVATLHRDGAGAILDAKTKNLAVLKTSFANDCSYCVGHTVALGKHFGLSVEQAAALEGDYIHSSLFDEREKAVIWWAEEVTNNNAKYNKECFENLRKHFSEAEIVELTLISGMFNMVNKFNEALHVQLEDQPEVDKIVRTAHLPQEVVTDYARHRVAELDAGGVGG